MQAASGVVRQVLGQPALAAGPALSRLPSVLSSGRLAALSWPATAVVQQLSGAAAARKPDEDEEQQQQQQAAGAGSSDGTSTSSSGDGAAGSSEEASTSGGGADAEGGASSGGGFGGLGSGFASFRQRLVGGDGEAEPLQKRAARLLAVVRREVADAVLPRQERASLTRAYDGPTYQAPDAPYEGSTALAPVAAPQSRFGRLVAGLQERLGGHPLLSKLSAVDLTANPVYKKGAELADDLRDKYETSDHPAVHRVEDVKEKLFGASETAQAMAKIRGRDPRFEMARLLAGVRYDAPIVVKAFLTHDLATLRAHCGPELLERMGGMFANFEAQDLYEDPTILFTGEPELVELKLVEDEPLVVVQFSCQQIKCTRDKFGNVVDGDPNSIQRVFYFWGLQQEETGVVLPDGRVLPPRWVIKDMMWQATLMLA